MLQGDSVNGALERGTAAGYRTPQRSDCGPTTGGTAMGEWGKVSDPTHLEATADQVLAIGQTMVLRQAQVEPIAVGKRDQCVVPPQFCLLLGWISCIQPPPSPTAVGTRCITRFFINFHPHPHPACSFQVNSRVHHTREA